MTSGLGISIGTVNVVSARIGEHDPRPIVRTRRTAVGFDDCGSARLGGITKFSTAINEFADLGRDPESVYVDGRIWSPATIFASVVQGLVAAEPAAGVVATHPAGYSAKQLDLLCQGLDLAGVGQVQLVPEPVAAAHWLDTEHGPLDSGFALVYDLGGNSLDVAVVRTGTDWPDHPVVGKPVRSYEFGGRPLGVMIARCAGDRAIGPAEPGTGSVSLMSFVDPEGLRREHIRDSLEVVRTAVRSAGVALSDISRVLVVGGAARPPQVADILAELGPPVTVAADSAHCVAIGAATMAAESVPLASASRAAPAPIFSGAAVFSAVAMSAATILGNGAAETVVPDPEGMPLQTPGAVLYEIHGEAQVERSGTGWSVSYAPLPGGTRIAPAGVSRPYGPHMSEPAAKARNSVPDRGGDRSGTHTSPRDRHGVGDDPARFRNPLPFGPPDLPVRPAPGSVTPDTPGKETPGDTDPDDGPDLDVPGAPSGGKSPSVPQHPSDGSDTAPEVPGIPDVPGTGPSAGEHPGNGLPIPGNSDGGATDDTDGSAGAGGGESGAGDSGAEGPGGFGPALPGGFGPGASNGSGTGDSGAPGGDGTESSGPGDTSGSGTEGTGGSASGDSGGSASGNSGGGSGDSGAAAPGDPGGSGSGQSGGYGAGTSAGSGRSDSGAGDTSSGGFGGGRSRGGSDSGGADSSKGSTSRGSVGGGADSSKGSSSRGSDSGGAGSGGSDGGSSRGKGSRGSSSGGKSGR